MPRRRFSPGRRPRRPRRRRRAEGDGRQARADRDAPSAPTGPVELPAALTVGELSGILGQSHVETVKALMRVGILATVNETVDFETAALVASGFEVQVLRPREKEESTAGIKVGIDEELTEENAVPRPPVVTVLGHVDHGKTTVLDAIRGSSVVASEAGGITQSIGAYQVERDGHSITFIDTPGHRAFTAMRASGAQVTDLAVLVVAADDGVMPQTIEAIDHIRAAGVPMIVAINKMDLPGADADRVKAQLTEHDIVVEDYGGDVVSVSLSALRGEGIDGLLESILLVSEVSELKANPDRPGMGVVVESNIDRERGPVATLLVRAGTVRLGDNIVAGTTRGHIRAMTDGFGVDVEEAGPSTPIQVLGLSAAPNVGDQFDVVAGERSARQLVETREKLAARRGEVRTAPTLAEVLRRVRSGDVKELSLVVKTGTRGSVDAVRRSVEPLSNEEVQVNIIHSGTGAVNESDVMLAAASDGIVVAFQTDAETGAAKQAAAQGVEIRRYDIIYNLIDDMDAAVKGLLAPEEREVVLGQAAVQQIFSAGRRNRAAGVRVTAGHLARNAAIRVLRNGEQVFSGRVSSMRHFRDDVRELATGFEGGVTLESFNEFEEGDILEAFETQLSER